VLCFSGVEKSSLFDGGMYNRGRNPNPRLARKMVSRGVYVAYKIPKILKIYWKVPENFKNMKDGEAR
jgi:hypothetical protein